MLPIVIVPASKKWNSVYSPVPSSFASENYATYEKKANKVTIHEWLDRHCLLQTTGDTLLKLGMLCMEDVEILF